MNSKQLNFFAHPKEINNILNFLWKKNAKITIEPFLKKDLVFYDDDFFLENDKLFFRILIFRNNELEKNIIREFIEPPNYYLFDNTESNLIQFEFPKIREEIKLNRCRFYFVTGYWLGDDFIKKDPEFINWATNLIRNFKREFLKCKEPIHNEYCTELVRKLYENKEIDLKHF